MIEPLLTRIQELEKANRRWKTLCAILATVLLAVLTTGSVFLGIHGYRSVLLNREAMLAAEEARMRELVAREQAERARQQAEQAVQEAKKRDNKE